MGDLISSINLKTIDDIENKQKLSGVWDSIPVGHRSDK